MELAEAIEEWIGSHGSSLSSATQADIRNIATAAVGQDFGGIECAELSDDERDGIIDAAAETSGLSAGAIGEFLDIVVAWDGEGGNDAESGLIDEDDEDAADELDDEEFDQIDDELDDLDDEEFDQIVDDELHDELDELDELDEDLIDEDLSQIDSVDGEAFSGLIDDDSEVDEVNGASDPAFAVPSWSDEDRDEDLDDADERDADLPIAAGATASAATFAAAVDRGAETLNADTDSDAIQDELNGAATAGSAFSDAATPTPQGATDWVTIAYFAVAVLAFAFAIYFYFSSGS